MLIQKINLQNLGIPLPRTDQDEIRSFRFFLDVTAPSFAGVFDLDFWLGEIPRACHSDAAIWHAVISLGAIHECYAAASQGRPYAPSLKANRGPGFEFALRQFNSAIRLLVENQTASTEDKWRALIASVIFTIVCSIQGLMTQALAHVNAGRSILKELQAAGVSDKAGGLIISGATREHDKASGIVVSGTPTAGRSGGLVISGLRSPASLVSVHGMITTMTTEAQTMEDGGQNDQGGLSLENDGYSAWRSYRAPTVPPFITTENLARAGRASGALFSGMAVFPQIHARDIADVAVKGDMAKFAMLTRRHAPFSRVLAELGTTLGRLTSAGEDARMNPSRRKAVTILQLYHASLRTLVFCDPEEPDLAKRQAGLPAQFRRIVDLAEDALGQGDYHPSSRARSDAASWCRPASSTTQPLFIAAAFGCDMDTRQRALGLLRKYPRREGLWDTLFAAKLAEWIIWREDEARTALAKGAAGLMAQIHDVKVDFIGERRATAHLRTWFEWVGEIPGKSVTVQW